MDIVIDTILKIRSLLNDVNKKLDFEGNSSNNIRSGLFSF